VSQKRLPPPQAPACLERLYPSSQKGGTLIAEDVTDLRSHERHLSDPGGYRPRECQRCGHPVLHVHDYRPRVLRADPEKPVTFVVRHRCANKACGACWQTLPALLARHLWGRWRVVEASTQGSRPRRWPPVPQRTRRRWRSRLRSAARQLVQAVAASKDPALGLAAMRVGLEATRGELVATLARSLSAVAALLHRLAPGVRLM